MERMQSLQRSTEGVLASEKSRATDATSRLGELEEKVRSLESENSRQSHDLADLREHNQRLGAENKALSESLQDTRDALNRARSEHGAAARDLAGLRESSSHAEKLLRGELSRCLKELESAIGARERAEAAQREGAARTTAAEVARAGLQEQVSELTSQLASSRHARALMQNSLAEQIAGLKGVLERERKGRREAEDRGSRLQGLVRGYEGIEGQVGGALPMPRIGGGVTSGVTGGGGRAGDAYDGRRGAGTGAAGEWRAGRTGPGNSVAGNNYGGELVDSRAHGPSAAEIAAELVRSSLEQIQRGGRSDRDTGGGQRAGSKGSSTGRASSSTGHDGVGAGNTRTYGLGPGSQFELSFSAADLGEHSGSAGGGH